MAQTGYTPILIYSSSTAAQAPAAGSLTNSTLGSELAINITDGKLFYKDNANAVQVIGWKTVPTTAGGTGLTSYTAGDMLYYASGTALTKLAIGASGRWLGSSGTAPQWNAPAALTKTDDTNVTLTLGGSASTALLNAASLTLGWTGQLATTRGGTGLSSFTANGIVYASSTSALATGSALTFDGTNFATTGSATATAFIPTGSTVPTNGMYLSAANRVAFATASGIRAYLASDGSLVHFGPEAVFYRNNTGGTVSRLDIIPTALKTQLRTFESGAPSELEITSSKVSLVSCNLAVSSGNGIDFSATAGTGTSELLDDYEEGTFTPTFTGLTLGNGTISGTYSKVGNIVTVEMAVNWGSTTSATSITGVTGLPFALMTATNNTYAVCNTSYLKQGVGWYFGGSTANYGSTSLNNVIAGAGTALLSGTAPATFGNADYWAFSMTYMTTT